MKTLYFFDTKTTYAYKNNTIYPLHHTKHHPKNRSFDIISLPPNALLHSPIEIDKADSSHISTLPHNLYDKAREKGILTLPNESYTHYFCEREHLFDEQKCVYESFFHIRDKNLKAHILTSDIFLPLALPCYKDFIVLIPPYLCYFENTTFKEALKITAPTQPNVNPNINLCENLSSLIAYLQEAYHKHFDTLYYFSDDVALLDTLLACNAAQNLPTPLPLNQITDESKDFDFYTFRAYLAFSYALKYKADSKSHLSNPLPNFTPQPSIYARFLPLLLLGIILFVFVIPLALTLYNHHLQSQITALNTQNEMLFAPLDSLPQGTDIHSLSLTHTQLSHTLNELESWQQSYPKRYAFMESIFSQCATNNITLESISFAFSHSHFIATLKLKADSKLSVSAFLAKLNKATQTAFLQPLDSMDSNAKSHIIVVQNVL